MARMQSLSPGTAYWPDGMACILAEAYRVVRLNRPRIQHSHRVQPGLTGKAGAAISALNLINRRIC